MRLTRRLVGLSVFSVLASLTAADARGPQVASDAGLRELPVQEPGSVRLGLQDASDVQVQVSIRQQTMRCDELEAHVQVLQASDTKAESYACFGVEHPTAVTELFLGHDAQRHQYRIVFEYAKTDQSVAYTIRRVAGAGIIESQRVVVTVAAASQ